MLHASFIRRSAKRDLEASCWLTCDRGGGGGGGGGGYGQVKELNNIVIFDED